jgi:ABC-type glutathione transport system ATPase component
MIKFGDICVIIGRGKSGKTLLAKTLSKSLQSDFIYLDYNFVGTDYLYDFYDRNKNKNTVIVFDNYVKMKRNQSIDKLFKKNKKFTLIYVMNYIDTFILDLCDIIYLNKELNYDMIKHFHEKLKYYFKNISLDLLTNGMEDLSEFGFLCFDKDRRFKIKEKYLKI